jgi:hypothetical protein
LCEAACKGDIKNPLKRKNFHMLIKTMKLKTTCCLFCIGWFLTSAAVAQSPVTLTVDTQFPGWAIPANYAGLSFETWVEGLDRGGVSGRLFSPTNAQLITLGKGRRLCPKDQPQRPECSKTSEGSLDTWLSARCGWASPQPPSFAFQAFGNRSSPARASHPSIAPVIRV